MVRCVGMVAELFTANAAEPLLDHAGVEAARLVRVARDRLVSGTPSVTHALLAKARGVSENTVRQWLRRHREAGRLMAVDHQGVLLIPAFQFDDTYDLDTEVATIVETLTHAGMSSWAVWRWFYTENPWVERRPVDMVTDGDTQTVLEIAARMGGEQLAG